MFESALRNIGERERERENSSTRPEQPEREKKVVVYVVLFGFIMFLVDFMQLSRERERIFESSMKRQNGKSERGARGMAEQESKP